MRINYIKNFLFSLFILVLFSLFLPTFSLASCDFGLEKLLVCYNSKRLERSLDPSWGTCYSGNWRVRSSIRNVGKTASLGYYQAGGPPEGFLIYKKFLLKPAEKIDTNNTYSLTLCGSIIAFTECYGDSSEYNSFKESLPPKDIPPCSK